MDRRQVLASVAAAGITVMGSRVRAHASRPSARLSVTPVSFRDWFPQTPDFLKSGRPAPRQLTLGEFPGFVADELGIQQIELWSLYFEDLTPAYCATIKSAAKKARVGISNIQLDNIGADLAAVDDAERSQAIDIVKGWMRRAALVGAPRVRANTDQPVAGRPFDPERIADSFRQLARYGEEVGVDILLENHTGYSASIDNVLAVYERVQHERCKLLADWGNSAAADTEARIADLARMFPALGFVSAKGVSFDDDYRHLGYDIGAIVRATESAGYRGIYSIELFTMGKAMPEDPVRAVRSMAQAISANLSRT